MCSSLLLHSAQCLLLCLCPTIASFHPTASGVPPVSIHGLIIVKGQAMLSKVTTFGQVKLEVKFWTLFWGQLQLYFFMFNALAHLS